MRTGKELIFIATTTLFHYSDLVAKNNAEAKHEQTLRRHHDDIIQFINERLLKAIRRSPSPVNPETMRPSKSVGMVRGHPVVEDVVSNTKGTESGGK